MKFYNDFQEFLRLHDMQIAYFIVMFTINILTAYLIFHSIIYARNMRRLSQETRKLNEELRIKIRRANIILDRARIMNNKIGAYYRRTKNP